MTVVVFAQLRSGINAFNAMQIQLQFGIMRVANSNGYQTETVLALLACNMQTFEAKRSLKRSCTWHLCDFSVNEIRAGQAIRVLFEEAQFGRKSRVKRMKYEFPCSAAFRNAT